MVAAPDSTVLFHSIQGASQSWLAFDWNGKKIQIDQTLNLTKEARDLALAARKQLAETTKQFKRCVKNAEQATETLASDPADLGNAQTAVKAVESLTKECRVTVKSYQEEIDNLTRRCKTSETAFSNIGQALVELPDPAAVLTTCLDQIKAQQAQMTQLLSTVEQLRLELDEQQKNNQNYKKELVTLQQKLSHAPPSGSASSAGLNHEEREELLQLRRECAEYEVEFRSLKNQDITIRKLEARIVELQAGAETQMKDMLEKAKQELAETEGRRAAEALEREAMLERKVQTLELQLKAERAGREATQLHLLQADEGVVQREAAWEAQRRILVDDAERLRESLHVTSRERDELRLRVEALQGDGRHGSAQVGGLGGASEVSMADLMLERSAYEAEVAELFETVAHLRGELRTKDDFLAEEKRAYQTKIANLERELSSLRSTVDSLEAKLNSAPSPVLVESMKRELRVLKRLQYNADDVDAEFDPEIAGGGDDEEKDLETVLVSKLRRAESDLVTERVNRNNLIKECEELRRALLEAEQAKDEAEVLVASLERDLERAIASPAAYSKMAPSNPAEEATADDNPDGLETIMDSSTGLSSPTAVKSSLSASERAEDDHSVATIVMAQRDRLRARCEALEAERDSFKRELQVQVQATESLKADNSKLYEKVRYLQNYNKAPTSRGAYNRGAGSNERDLDLEALEQRYEASVDPFRQFSKAERLRKLNEMSPMERAVFIVAKTVLATKEMRTALFFYMVALHFLVFVTTYHWSHEGGCHNFNNEHLSHLPPPLPAHYQKEAAAAMAPTKGNGT